MKRFLFLFCPFLITCSTYISAKGGGETVKSPRQIQQELNQAQTDYTIASKMFSPFYGGPLLTGGAHNCAVGHVNIQPYLFIIDNYGIYTSNRKTKKEPDFWNVNPVFIFQTGITNWLDFQISPEANYNTTRNQGSVNWGDLQTTLGFQLLKESPYVPALRLTFSETFPTGHYEHLNPAKFGTDAMGTGSFETQLTLNISKVLWNFPLHPMQVRGNVVYIIPSNVDVHGFNSYGGGYGTDGTVFPGNELQLYGAVEISIVQTWVFALDAVYKYFDKTRFSGYSGVSGTGGAASLGAPSGDQFSLAPAIEYNPSATQQFIFGSWFTVFGRNSNAFVSLVLTYEHYF